MQAKGKYAVVCSVALVAGLILFSSCAVGQTQKAGTSTKEPARISSADAYQKVKAGTALLVCAYPDDETFKKMQLDGAISFKEFESRLPGLKKDQEIIFY